MSSEFQFNLPSDKLACQSTLMCNEDVLSFSIFVFREKRIHPLKAKYRLIDMIVQGPADYSKLVKHFIENI